MLFSLWHSLLHCHANATQSGRRDLAEMLGRLRDELAQTKLEVWCKRNLASIALTANAFQFCELPRGETAQLHSDDVSCSATDAHTHAHAHARAQSLEI